MLTIGALPKPCIGHIGMIQSNAVERWRRLPGSPRIVLFGNAEGVAALAQSCGALHEPEVALNAQGTPLLPSVFARLRAHAGQGLCCYANCDILLLGDWMQAVEQVQRQAASFLAVGECWNLDVAESMTWQSHSDDALRAQVRERGVRRGKSAIDYFCFTPDLYEHCPPLALGRAYMDNWLLWQARRQGAVVADLSLATCVAHQNHGYDHVAGGYHATRFGMEARQNLRAAGGVRHLHTLHDCTHVLRCGVLRRSWVGTLHLMRPLVLLAAGIRTAWNRLRSPRLA